MAESNDPTTPTVEDKGLPKRLRGTRVAQDDVPAGAVAHSYPTRLDVALEHARLCARIAEDNRGRDILLLDLRGATPLVDFFVIVTAPSRRTANAIAIEVDAEMKKIGEKKLGIEGSEEGRWILMDYGDFVVHIFNDEARQYYSLEDIWGDAAQLEWADPDKPRPERLKIADEPESEPSE
jgi:ribosome-associated protein